MPAQIRVMGHRFKLEVNNSLSQHIRFAGRRNVRAITSITNITTFG